MNYLCHYLFKIIINFFPYYRIVRIICVINLVRNQLSVLSIQSKNNTCHKFPKPATCYHTSKLIDYMISLISVMLVMNYS